MLTLGVSNVKGLNLVSKESANTYANNQFVHLRNDFSTPVHTTACRVSSLSSSAFFPAPAPFLAFGGCLLPPAFFVGFWDCAILAQWNAISFSTQYFVKTVRLCGISSIFCSADIHPGACQIESHKN